MALRSVNTKTAETFNNSICENNYVFSQNQDVKISFDNISLGVCLGKFPVNKPLKRTLSTRRGRGLRR